MKRKILIFIFLVITVGGIIFTAFTAYRFSTITDLAIKHSAETIRDIYIYSQDKQEAMNLIKNMPNIQKIEIVDRSKYVKSHKNIVVIPLNTDKKLIIHFKSLAEFENEKYNVILETIIINLIFIAISNLLLNWLISPYLNVFEELRKSIEKARHGDFSEKLHTKLKNELQKIIENYNLFLDQLNKNFALIANNLSILIPNVSQKGNRLVAVQRNMEILADVNKFKKIIEEDANADEIFERIIDIFKNKFHLTNFKLYAVLNAKQEIKVIYQTQKVCCDIDAPSLCRAYRTSKEMNSIKFPHVCPNHICKDTKYICIPFSTGGTFTGVASINFSIEEYKEKKDLIPYIESYLNEAASIIEAKYTLDLIKETSLRDQLTGLYNRRYLEEILDKLAASAIREKSMLGILMIDVDYFKKVNDTLGHDAGDEVLSQLAKVLANGVRESDFAIRFGGEEFIVVLQNVKNEESVMFVAEKIRKMFEKMQITINNKTFTKTISIGVSIFPKDTLKIWESIKFADIALYEAKRTGRNKVVRFNPDMMKEAAYDQTAKCSDNSSTTEG
ncbi:MAG: GGDEF domain-containing protein [Epsilonproteobacteria bacterium]|nr:GGDEF domain-containing protein [Campylobacterota bacterium]